MSPRWLVTGARGFLGRHVCAALERAGHDVLRLDRTPPAPTDGLVADLTIGPPDLRGRRVDVVAHLAGFVHHDAPPEAFERSIVDGTRHLLDSLARLDLPPRAFIYASSVAVYGRTTGELVTEAAATAATTVYGRSKRRAEELVAAWAGRRGVAASILRLPGLVGPGMRGGVARLVRRLRRWSYLGIGPGTARRSVVLAEDVAAALPDLAGASGTFHLTDRAHPSFLDLETAIRARLGRRPPPRLPLPMARLLARVGDLAERAGVEGAFSTPVLERTLDTLTFDDSLAVERFGWAPTPVVERVAEWVEEEIGPVRPLRSPSSRRRS